MPSLKDNLDYFMCSEISQYYSKVESGFLFDKASTRQKVCFKAFNTQK